MCYFKATFFLTEIGDFFYKDSMSPKKGNCLNMGMLFVKRHTEGCVTLMYIWHHTQVKNHTNVNTVTVVLA